MENRIKIPEFVLRAKTDSRYLLNGDNKPLFAFLEIVFFLILFLVIEMASFIPLMILAGFVSGVTGQSFKEIQSADWITAADLILRIIHTFIYLIFCRLVQKRKADTLGFTKHKLVSQYIGGLIAGFALFSSGVLITVVTGSASISMNNETISIPLYLALILGWIIQGMAEEVMCRGYFLVSLARKLPMPVAIAVSSIAFGCIHLGNANLTVLAFINLVLFGVFASVVYLRTKNIWFVSALHSVWNYVQGNLYGIPVSGGFNGPHILTTTFDMSKSLINGGAFGLEGGLAVTIILVIGTLITIYCPSLKKNA